MRAIVLLCVVGVVVSPSLAVTVTRYDAAPGAYPLSPWTADPVSGMDESIVDLGGGAYGLRIANSTANSTYSEYWFNNYFSAEATLSARLRLDSTDNTPTHLLQLTLNNNAEGGLDPSLAFGVAMVEGKLQFVITSSTDASTYAVLKEWDTELHTVQLYVNRVTSVVKASWDGQPLPAPLTWENDVTLNPGAVEFGAGMLAHDAGNTTATFQWVSFDDTDVIVPEPATLSLLAVSGLLLLRRRSR